MITDGLKHISRKSKLTELGVSSTSAAVDRVSRGSLRSGSGMSRYRAQESKNSRNNALDISRGISNRGKYTHSIKIVSYFRIKLTFICYFT